MTNMPKREGVPVMSTPRLGNPLETDTLLLQLNSDRLAAMWTHKPLAIL